MLERRFQADEIVNKYSRWAIAPGVLPVPFVDWAVLSGLQLKMIHELCQLYEVPFSQDRAKIILTTVLAGAAPHATTLGAVGMFGRYFKALPGIGTIAGIATSTAAAVGTTYAVGAVFARQLEEGATLDAMDARKMSEDVKAKYEAKKAEHEAAQAAASPKKTAAASS